MSSNKKFFILFILFFFNFNIINASEKIAFLDLDYVLNIGIFIDVSCAIILIKPFLNLTIA